MHPLSDKELERLSREAAEQYDVEQNTSGWEQLEQKLNKQLPVSGKKERWRFLILIWLFALLSGGGLLWMLSGNNGPEFVLKQASSKVVFPDPNNVITDPSSPAGKKENKNTKQPEKTGDPGYSVPTNTEALATEKRKTTIAEKGIIQKDPSITAATTKFRNRNIRNHRNSTNVNVGVDATMKKETGSLIAQPDIPSSAIAGDKQDLQITSATDNKQIPDTSIITADNSTLAAPTENKLPSDRAALSIAVNTKTETSPDSLSKNVSTPRTKTAFKKGLEIGLVVAPDMSTVKFTNTDNIGFNYGIQLGYRVSQRFTINTGMLYTRKNYTSLGKDFQPPKGSWLDNVNLDMVEGNCFMFDIPLNIRYDLNTSSNHRYFLSSGLSTYLMKKENYHYQYRYPNGNPGYRYRSYPSSEHHLLSILNISAGFEKKLNKQFTLQAEPYLKIPLQGIGYGNIQLNSYGMYFSLKYKPAF